MKPQEIKVRFYEGYSGQPKCDVHINEKVYVLELDKIEVILEETIKARGYNITKTSRQKYPRIEIKSDANEDYDMLARENKAMAECFERLGYSQGQISDIANGAI